MTENAQDLRDLLSEARVLPVLTVRDSPSAVAVARALAEGGLGTVEITLRSEAALSAIEAIARQLPEVTVGAGTLTSPDQFRTVADAGARFAVSPGWTSSLAEAARKDALPWLPGVATVSEAMVAQEAGFEILKLFPAKALGGRVLLKSIYGPLPDLAFCPTGGINASSYRDYLELPNVLCVGGSWMVPRKNAAAVDGSAITRLAEEISR